MALNAGALQDGGTPTLVTPKDINPGGPPGGPSASPSPTPPYVPSAGAQGPTTPDPGPGSITTNPGYTPDYNADITSDPGYASAQTAAQQAQATAAAQRQAALRAQVIQYGGLPSGFQDAYGDIDQATLDAAKNNQFSTLASASRNYQQSVDQFRKALAARGALQSGDLNYGQNQLDTGYGQTQYDAANQFGAGVTGDINAYTGVLDQNRQNLVGAIQQATTNAYNDPANRPVAATTATRDAAKSALYGMDIYTSTDANGNVVMYTRDGSPFTPPSASAAPTAYAPGSGPYSWGIGGKS